MAADLAIHSLTYIGVLLAVVVIYVFFAEGYFGDVVRIPNLRPLAFAAVPAVFFGLGWVLRHRSGIPGTATAIELIGALFVPVMLAALFRDGAAFPPDVAGRARWPVYGAVGVASAAFYAHRARTRALYRLLAIPMVWVAVGAFGLLIEPALNGAGDNPAAGDGISAMQMTLVLAAIALTPLVVRLAPGDLMRSVAVPAVRLGAASLPILVLLTAAFARSDAFARTGAEPILRDVAPAMAAALLVAAVAAWSIRASSWAWDGLSRRLRRDIRAVLAFFTNAAAGAGIALGAWDVIEVAWFGPILVGYAGLLAASSRDGGPSPAKRWTILLAAGSGMALSLFDPWATITAWIPVALAFAALSDGHGLGILRAAPSPRQLRFGLWITMLVPLGNGAGRIGWPDGTPWVLLAAAALLVSTRMSSKGWCADLAAVPAWIVGLAAPGSWLLSLAAAGSFTHADLGNGAAILAVTAVVVGCARGPWAARLAVASSSMTASVVLLGEALSVGGVTAAMLRTAYFAAIAAGFFGDSMRRRSSRRLAHAGIGHASALAAAFAAMPYGRSALVGIGALVAVHAAEIWGGARGRSALRADPDRRPLVRMAEVIPPLVVAVGIPLLSVISGHELAFVAAERPRFGLVLTAAAWVSIAVARMAPSRLGRRALLGSAVATALAAPAVGAPSLPVVGVGTTSAAILLMTVAFLLRRPGASIWAWLAATGACLVWASFAGMAQGDLYLVLAGSAGALTAAPLAATWVAGRPGGVPNPWLQPPLGLGLLLVPVSLGFGMADGRFVAEMMAAASLLYALTGYATRAGGAAAPAAAAAAMAYAYSLEGVWSPFDSPIRLMPFAAAAVAVAGLLPGRRGWRLLSEPAPGVLLVGIGVGALGVMASGSGDLAGALTTFGAILLGARLTRRGDEWLTIAGTASVLAGAVIAEPLWGSIATGALAVAIGTAASLRAHHPLARPGAFLAAACAAASVGEALEWGAAPTGVILATLAIAGAVAAAVAAALASAPRPGTIHRLLWMMPSACLAGLASVVLVATAVLRLDDSAAALVIGATSAVLAASLGTVATARASRLMAAVAGAAAAGSLASFLVAAGPAPATTVAVLLAIGTALTGTAVATERTTGGLFRLWWPTIAGLGQVGLAAAVVVGFGEFPLESARFAAPVGLFAVDAVAVGVAASRRGSRAIAFRAAALGAAAYGSGALWLDPRPLSFAAATGLASIALAGAAWILDRAGDRVWTLPCFVMAQVGGLAVVAATGRMDEPATWGVTTAYLAAQSLVSAVFTSRSRSTGAGILTAVGSASTIGAMLAWMEAGPATVSAIGLATATVVGTATTVLQRSAGPRPWPPGGHLLTAFGLILAVPAAAHLEPGPAWWILAAACAVASAHLALNAHAAPPEVGLRELAGLAASAGAVFLMLAVDSPPITVPLMGTFGLAATAAALSTSHRQWTMPLGIIAASASTTAILVALSDPDPLATGLLSAGIAFAGANLAAAGLVTGRLALIETAVATWLVAAMLATADHISLASHSTLVPISATLLAILAIDRIRRGEGRSPRSLRLAEWCLMSVPMVVAAADGVSDLRYLALLAAEGVALGGWGILTEVRRRAFIGITGLFAAAALFATVPLVEETRSGLSGGTWLAIGAGAAVVLIALGSTLEQYRTRMGAALGRLSSILEDWE